MKNISARFDSVKSYVPALLSSSKEKVSEVFTVMTQSESDFLTKAENTDTDIKELLKSKMEIEVILGLKFLMMHVLKGKDISSFHTDIVNLFLNNNFLIKKLCLNLIDHISLNKCEVLILLYNFISKKVLDNDPLQRWTTIHLINSLKLQSIALETSKHLIPLFTDSNPLIKRIALVALVQYIKANNKSNSTISISEEEFSTLLQKYFSDPHPLVFSTAFYAICELKNKDYLNLNLPQYFTYYCGNLNIIDDFYYERVIFSLINFSKLFLLNNFEKNHKYFSLLFNSLYQNVKHSTNSSKIITSLYGIFDLLLLVEQLQLNSISKEELQLFKNGKQLAKLGKILIKLILCSKTNQDKFASLELINKFIINSSVGSFFENIKIQLDKKYQIFYLKMSEKEYINIKKLEILINLANDGNIKNILDEFKRNLSYPNINLKKMIIKTIYHICKNNSNGDRKINSNNNNIQNFGNNLRIDIPSLCVEKLIDLLKLKEEGVISQIIICLRKLILEIKEQTKFVLIYNIKNYIYKKNVASSIAKANIIWMVGQYIKIIPTVSVDFFRRLLIEIDKESDEVKSQILGFAMRINSELDTLANNYSPEIRDQTISRIKNLIKYSTDKLLWDKNYNIREKARMVEFMIKNNIFNKELDFVVNYSLENEENNKSLKNEKNEKTVSSLSILSKIMQDGFEEEKNSIFNKKFVFDVIDKNVDPNFYKITLDDIIGLNKSEKEGKNEKKNDDDNKYVSVTKKGNVGGIITNFDSGINMEELRAKMKNQLDELFSENVEDEDYEVEIQKD